MSKAYLTVFTPESCAECPIIMGACACYVMEDPCIILPYTTSRHPDCPLVIVDEGLPVVWDESSSFAICQKCKGVVGYEDSYCNHCGVKLAPPAEANNG